MAIDELEAVVERHTLIQEQLADLHAAKDELLKVIEELEKESRKSFKETFEAIRSSFKQHFQTLFNGGEADLILTASDDALDAGVEILAKPPGKEMRSMQLMSGGEKSLTALALLFGCFEVRPSPFCILDEVDAALDEANVERFGTLLKSFAGKLQFLVITHNKRTMACADSLIGVSMQEKGVSQIISLDFRRLETVASVS
jgi:chromosome segregation protein